MLPAFGRVRLSRRDAGKISATECLQAYVAHQRRKMLRVEEQCKKGLFFICPTPVLKRIYSRLGNRLAEYSLQPGAITFHDYSVDINSPVRPFPLAFGSTFTTTHDQLALAFSSPQDLPPKNSYSKVVSEAIKERLSRL